MAAGRLAIPGSDYGPCKSQCTHVDCAQTRTMAATACAICGEPIGYDRAYYQRNDWTVLEHMSCVHAQIERTRSAA